ncbi:hypothetical protein [Saccharopolyspora flava]|uniref:Uncharacterized protein n=1 Tax=Saccharopolyspora flava TaxID=95161 RepID=A0A1I6UMT0_9PSEU|nr:hypothetical protein [Saccharopolyspora flava]SFT02759.1 hypothetical protein SAMN05660874_05065 [Saccharopolyspora flava]
MDSNLMIAVVAIALVVLFVTTVRTAMANSNRIDDRRRKASSGAFVGTSGSNDSGFSDGGFGGSDGGGCGGGDGGGGGGC